MNVLFSQLKTPVHFINFDCSCKVFSIASFFNELDSNRVGTVFLLCCPGGRDRELEDIGADEIRADGMVYRDKKDQLEVAIGDGMEFTIHGEWSSNIIDICMYEIQLVEVTKNCLLHRNRFQRIQLSVSSIF